MKKRAEQIERLLDGELGEREAKTLRDSLTPEERERLDRERSLLASLAALPVADPSKDLAAAVRAGLANPISLARLQPGPSTAAKVAGWVGGGLTVAALVVGGTLWLGGQDSRPPPRVQAVEAPSTCRVARVDGRATRIRGELSRKAGPGTDLVVQDQILVPFGSRAELAVEPGARVALARDTRVRVERLQDRIRELRLSAGGFRLVNQAGESRRVKIGLGEKSVRAESPGGELACLLAAPERIACAAVRGTARVETKGKEMTVPEGQFVRITAGQPVGQPEPSPESVPLEVSRPKKVRPGQDRITVSGRSDSHARVWINGQPVELDQNGNFSTEVAAGPGDVLTVLAEDLLGHTAKATRGPLQLLGSKEKPASPPEEEAPKAKRYKVTW